MGEFELRDTKPAAPVVGDTLKRTEDVSHDRAWSMPTGFYTDPAVLALKRDRLFLQEWICLGKVDE